MADAPDRLIDGERLSALTGLTDRRHRQLAKAGWFQPPQRGQYVLVPTLQGLFRYYRERGDSESPRGALLKAQREGQELRNRLREMEVKQATSALVPLDDAHEVIRVTVEPIKLLIDSMPANLSARVNPEKPEHAREHLQAWVDHLRRAASTALAKANRREIRKSKQQQQKPPKQPDPD